jgi:hypothetical protein
MNSFTLQDCETTALTLELSVATAEEVATAETVAG